MPAPGQIDVSVAIEGCEQQGEPAVVQTNCRAACGPITRGSDQRLKFDEHRPTALHERCNARAGCARSALGEKQLARVFDIFEAALGHREDTDLLGGAESILARAKQSKDLTAVTLEGEHDIDQVFEYPRSRDRPFLGDVPNQDQDRVPRLRDRSEFGRALAHLRDRSGCRLDPIRAQRLDRIDHDDRRCPV